MINELNVLEFPVQSRDFEETVKQAWILSKVKNNENVSYFSFKIDVTKEEKSDLIKKIAHIEGISEIPYNYVMFDRETGWLYNYASLIEINNYSEDTKEAKFYVSFYGNVDQYEHIKEKITAIYPLTEERDEVGVMWAFRDNRGDLCTRYRNLKSEDLPFTEMYPFIKEGTLGDLYEDFFDDSSNILILKGPAGTGKTSFIRGMLFHLGKSAFITYDEELANSDQLFERFFDSDEEFIVFEDADAFLTSRTDGNRSMHRFLNMGDGLISRPNKKIIFTTNIESISDIDSALTRPGRCYDIIEFEPLTVEQAKVVAQMSGKDLDVPQSKVTVAEIFNSQKYRKDKKKSRIGFI